VSTDPTGSGVFSGETVVLTGDFAQPRGDLAARVAQEGGAVRDSVTAKTTLLFVAGSGDLPAPTGKMKKALDLRLAGSPLRILRESDLMKALRL
jgi:NAD-dependent DNA ligase